MAGGTAMRASSPSVLAPFQDTVSEYNCIKCSAYESQLNQTLEELESARKIIDILQRELDTTSPSMIARENNGVPGRVTPHQANSAKWITVPAKYTSARANRNNLRVPTITNQQVATWKRYTPLHNLQDSDAALIDRQSHHVQVNQATPTSNKTAIQHGKGRKIPSIVNGKHQTGEDQKPGGMKPHVRTHFSTQQYTKRKVLDRRPKVFVLGDSHARGIAGELLHQAKHRINTIGYVMPNAGFADIINSAECKINELTRADTVIMFGGSNDIEKSKECSNLTLIVNFLENIQNTNVILMEVPVRYDTEARPLICEQIVNYNKKLHKVTKKYKHVKLIRVTTSRNHFTTHGLHLNHSGKETIAKAILNNLPSNCDSQRLPTITLPWRDECGSVNAPITKRESSKVILDEKADTEEAREKTVIADGNPIKSKSKTGTEAMSELDPKETAHHSDKQDNNSKPPEMGETSTDVSRHSKSQRKCPKVKNDAFLWI